MNISDIELPSNRKFGFFFSVVFAVIGTYFINNHSIPFAYFFLALAVVFFMVTLVKAKMLYPINKLWMRLGFLLGMIVSPIMLGIIFFGLFTPIGLLMKLFGRDELRLKLYDRKSQWKERHVDNMQTASFKNQF